MVTILGYQLDGPYDLQTTTFKEVAGVYVIYTSDARLDVGETDQLASRISNHERSGCWLKNALGKPIFLAFFHESNLKRRLQIEQYFRVQLGPICGD